MEWERERKKETEKERKRMHETRNLTQATYHLPLRPQKTSLGQHDFIDQDFKNVSDTTSLRVRGAQFHSQFWLLPHGTRWRWALRASHFGFEQRVKLSTGPVWNVVNTLSMFFYFIFLFFRILDLNFSNLLSCIAQSHEHTDTVSHTLKWGSKGGWMDEFRWSNHIRPHQHTHRRVFGQHMHPLGATWHLDVRHSECNV